ncbi:MAG: excinuclease ABC subunit UvrC [Candidatus Omnitrophota bacterium]|jgi:excinuclease ABC subunit C
MNKLQKKIKNLPDTPGVYLFKDAQGRIIYIGKAKSLKKRAGSYFGRPQNEKNQALVAKISDLDYIVTYTGAQAEILEAALVSEKQPRYNIDLKDDKSFPLIKITREDFPVVSIARRKKPGLKDNARYFGPYTKAWALRYAFKMLRKIFTFRSCKKMPDKACLYYRLKLCPAPCEKKISQRAYARIIRDIILFLGLKYEKLINELSSKMLAASREENFEEAAKLRDQIDALSSMRKAGAYAAGFDELEDLKSFLKLKKLPNRIEAFDVSNISGKEATGSMVSFFNAKPDKNNYRRFRIKTVKAINDYEMLAEIVRRRYSRLKDEKLPLPDLVLIDGGRAHLLTGEKEIEKLGLNLEIASIAKDRENIYVKKRVLPFRLREDTPALNLIRRIRDEAHRFAVAYHHILRRRRVIGK